MRALVVLAVGLAALVGLLVPSPADSPLGRVASLNGDAPDPLWDTPVDGAAVRRAGELLPEDARYLVWAPSASPLLQGNLKAATQLLFAPALPVRNPRDAEWVLSYRASPSLPPGLRASGRRSVGRGIQIIRIAR